MQFILGHFSNVSSITMRTLPTPNLPSIPLEDRKNDVFATGSTHMYICVCVLNSPSSFSLPLWIPVSSYFSLFFALFPCILHRDSISVFPCVFRWGPDSLVACIFSRSTFASCSHSVCCAPCPSHLWLALCRSVPNKIGHSGQLRLSFGGPVSSLHMSSANLIPVSLRALRSEITSHFISW